MELTQLFLTSYFFLFKNLKISNGITANKVSSIISDQLFNDKAEVFATLLKNGKYISSNKPVRMQVFTIMDILSLKLFRKL